MFPGFLRSLREGVEAALLMGIVLGAVRKTNHPELHPPVWAGTISAMFVSLIAALIINLLGAELEGKAEEIYEAGLLPPIIEHVLDINYILDEQSNLGSLLKVLFGYNWNPSLSEILACLAYFALVAFGISRIMPVKALAQDV